MSDFRKNYLISKSFSPTSFKLFPKKLYPLKLYPLTIIFYTHVRNYSHQFIMKVNSHSKRKCIERKVVKVIYEESAKYTLISARFFCSDKAKEHSWSLFTWKSSPGALIYSLDASNSRFRVCTREKRKIQIGDREERCAWTCETKKIRKRIRLREASKSLSRGAFQWGNISFVRRFYRSSIL